MTVNEIRQAFLNFFAQKEHTIVPSASLIPHNDPTLLFTNSGMVPFKDVFLGKEQKTYIRAASSQRSVRAGGKHNDLENVGYTSRHHTFFEMLGNFSFGDYFKKEAIYFAWELLTTVYMLPADKLWVTVYIDDDEAYNIWQNDIGVPIERIIRIGDNKGARYASDNFWQMGDTGPCGPCSEIFYDHGEEIYGGPPGSPDEDGDRYTEIWNLVFMQFNRDESGKLTPLPKPCIDTGMGLERLAAVLQKVHSNYEIDLFVNLIQAVSDITHCTNLDNNSLKVIADHLRSSSFLIIDGVLPSNEGRSYVLRRIIRRAIRHGYKLNVREAFLYKLVPNLVKEMGQAYPELVNNQQHIINTLQQEEERFFETLFNGMDILETAVKNLPASGVLSGGIAFKLHDTYGFPLDLTADICREKNLYVNEEEFDEYMEKQRTQARTHGKFKSANQIDYHGQTTKFHGYTTLENPSSIIAIYAQDVSVKNLSTQENAIIILTETPFYGESGGQVGDRGILVNDNNIFKVTDTQKLANDVIAHHGILLQGVLSVGQNINAVVDSELRLATQRNHSATHLLHKALHVVLGSHVQQKGSLVDEHKLRFDFSHNKALTLDEIMQIEQIVNTQILQNLPTSSKIMHIEQAKQAGAMALFGEKYGDEVRVLNIGDSIELCGGTHVQGTGDIGLFKILTQSGISSGIRRIEGITGFNALNYLQELELHAYKISNMLKTPLNTIDTKVEALQDNLKQTQKELLLTQNQLAMLENANLVDKAIVIGNIKLLIANIPRGNLRDIADMLKHKIANSIIILYAKDNEKANIIVSIDKALTDKIKANEIANQISFKLGGKGGGRADMAQGGGTEINKLEEAIIEVRESIQGIFV